MLPPLPKSKVLLICSVLCILSSVMLCIVVVQFVQPWVFQRLNSILRVLVYLSLSAIVGCLKAMFVSVFVAWFKPAWRWQVLMMSLGILAVLEAWFYAAVLKVPLFR